ncbi:hypothetical protein CTAYLR_000247, partial [Chrysophaeum taylorii]
MIMNKWLSAMVVLLLCASARASVPWSDQLVRFKQSSVELYQNQWDRLSIMKERKERPDTIDFMKHYKLEQAGVDFGKMLSLVWLTLYTKWYTPVTVYFFPDMLPSAFQSQAVRDKRSNDFSERRRKAVLEAVGADAALGGVATNALQASSKGKALEHIISAAHDLSVHELPNNVFYATSRLFDGPYRIFPRPLHKRAINQGLKKLAEGDLALRRSKLDDLPLPVLKSACEERGVAVSGRSEMLTGLNEWLVLTKSADAKHKTSTDKTRLALVALNTASAIRRHDRRRSS